MKKKPFVTKEQLEEIVKNTQRRFISTMKRNPRKCEGSEGSICMEPGIREYFAVKATPNPFILDILKEYDCGCDCASLTELMLADSQGFDGKTHHVFLQ